MQQYGHSKYLRFPSRGGGGGRSLYEFVVIRKDEDPEVMEDWSSRSKGLKFELEVEAETLVPS